MATHLLYFFFTDYITMAILLKLVCLEISEVHYTEPIGRYPILVFLGIYFFLRVFHVSYKYKQAHSFPINWRNNKIRKLRKGKADAVRWKEIFVKNLKVGDIVRMKYCNVCPADLLILDTSEQRYKEYVLQTNQRKIKGQNKSKIKRSVRDLGIRTAQLMAQKEYLGKLCKKLNGYVEYNPPNGLKQKFNGTFKLKNDPKVTHLTEDNLLLAGTKLYSSEMVGMVMYVGKDCSVFQKNFIEQWKTDKRRPKQAFMFKLLNKAIIGLLSLSLIFSLVNVILMATAEETYTMVKAIETHTIGFNIVKKFLAIFTICINLVPWSLRIVIEIVLIVNAYKIKYMQYVKLVKPVELLHEMEKAQSIDSSRSVRTRHSLNIKRKSSYNLGTQLSHKSTPDDSPTTPRPSIRRSTTGRVLNGTQIIDADEVASPGYKRKGNRKGTKSGKSKNLAKSIDEELTEIMANHLNVINYLVLPDLGAIDQVFFDKTDTLTAGKMKVAELTTYLKCYRVPHQGAFTMINECKANPDAFGYEDDQNIMMELEDYSEKSQEYLKEIEGEFNKEVLLEDESFDQIIDPSLFPDYGSLTATNNNKVPNPTLGNLMPVRGLNLNKHPSDRAIEKKSFSAELIANGTLTQFNVAASKDSPKEGLNLLTDLKHLNMLERKFKKSMNVVQKNPAISLIRPVAGKISHLNKLALNQGDSDSDLQEDEEIGGENRISFKIDKKLTDSNLIFDLTGKRDHLMDLLAMLMLSSEGSSVCVC
jgi:magnesium-transporting ATPase (P-type)